jgi:hypothetical protein
MAFSLHHTASDSKDGRIERLRDRSRAKKVFHSRSPRTRPSLMKKHIDKRLAFCSKEPRKRNRLGLACQYRLVNECIRQSSEAFPGLNHECRREIPCVWPRFDVIVSADSFSNRSHARFFRSCNAKRHLDYCVMEQEQRMIIKFPRNESVDAHKIYMRRQAQFGEQNSALRTTQFWMREIQRRRSI